MNQVRSWRVADLHQSQVADWIDKNVGDRNGYLDETELCRYVDSYGHDPAHHAAIKAITLELGFITMEYGGRITIPQGTATGNGISISVGGQQVSLGPITISIGGQAPVTVYNPPVRREPDSKEIARRLVGRAGSGRQSDVDLAIAELSLVPAALLLALERNRIEVRVCRDNVTEHHEDLKGLHAKGCPPWVNYDAVDGFYGKRTGITVATTIDTHGRRTLRQGALLKEVGRALDDLGGNFSRARSFRRGYESDLPTLKKEDQVFLTQEGDVGAEEAFAQSFVWFTANRRYLESSYLGLSTFWEAEESRGWGRFS